VPLEEYVLSVDAQTIRAEAARREQLDKAFRDISITGDLLEQLGPAINSGAGLFLYGEPGNGKTTIARRITRCFGQTIWIPRTLLADGQFVKLYDEAFHRPAQREGDAEDDNHDRRWVKIERPTVIVGGELTMDNLELRHDAHTNVCEAPLQLKSNCGVFLIDDFGRQRIEPAELLNRWIIPLESGHDFLTLPTGKKIVVPFEQLIIFSTNLDPADLKDEAFLRRIPYKIEIGDPTEEEFHALFKMFCRAYGCPYRAEVINWLIENHYIKAGRPLRRCHPRDLLLLVRNLCVYRRAPLDLRQEHFAKVVKTYFTTRGRNGASSSSRLAPQGESAPGRLAPQDAAAGREE
jgi:SpoVK/Ycf46/Vps4 family AAA+-type ATPase